MNSELGDFLAELERRETSPSTQRGYAADLRVFARWFEGSTGEAFAAAAVTCSDVRDYKAHLLTVEKRRPATVNRHLAALRAFARWAREANLVDETPALEVKGVKAVRPAPRGLEKREADRLVRTVERGGSKRDLAIVQVLRHTGIRVGELCSLCLGDVDAGERKGLLTVRQGKGAKFREVPLNADARRALRDYLAVRPAAVDDRLFRGQRGGDLRPRGVQTLLAKYARLAQLEDVTPHTLRHTFAKAVLDAGENLVNVAALLGHEDLNTTAIYTKPTRADLERAVAKIERE